MQKSDLLFEQNIVGVLELWVYGLTLEVNNLTVVESTPIHTMLSTNRPAHTAVPYE